jgi:hypothetical protein
MKKKVGILTRHCYPNYGSILQTFALQSALEMLDVNVEVINYVHPNDTPMGLVNANLSTSSFSSSLIKRSTYRLLQTPTFLSMGLTFRKHQKRLLRLTREVQDTEGLKMVTCDFDKVIAGSDQIWNRIISSIDKSYYLTFIDDRSKRASYAASLGSTKPLKEDENELLDAVGKMQNVSVREPSSAKWLNSCGISARSDVDPVLLHGKSFWSDFGGASRKEKPYILVYQLHRSEVFEQRLKEIKAKHGLQIIRVTPDWKHCLRLGSAKILVSPESFVSLIRDADFVVTDSFHGTAFSLRLGTSLYVIPPGKYSTRLTDVVGRVGLERLVVPFDISKPLPISPDYDSEKVEKILDDQAKDSWGYLEGLIKPSPTNAVDLNA